MRRRRLLLAALVLLLMAGVVGYLLWPAPRSAIILENAARVRSGMSLAEVEAIMGGPARDESTEWEVDGGFSAGFGLKALYQRHDLTADQIADLAHKWSSNEADAWVWLDDDGKVLAATSHGAWRESWFRRQLNTWLPW